MSLLPTIHKTKTGRKYFIVNGRKFIISSRLTKHEFARIYKLLQKKTKNKGTSVRNVITINNQTGRRTARRNTKQKETPFHSTIDPLMRVIATSGNSGDSDLINSLVNTVNEQKDLLKQLREKLDPPTQPAPAQPAPPIQSLPEPKQPLTIVDYSDKARQSALQADPLFIEFSNSDKEFPENIKKKLLKRYGFSYNKKHNYGYDYDYNYNVDRPQYAEEPPENLDPQPQVVPQVAHIPAPDDEEQPQIIKDDESVPVVAPEVQAKPIKILRHFDPRDVDPSTLIKTVSILRKKFPTLSHIPHKTKDPEKIEDAIKLFLQQVSNHKDITQEDIDVAYNTVLKKNEAIIEEDEERRKKVEGIFQMPKRKLFQRINDPHIEKSKERRELDEMRKSLEEDLNRLEEDKRKVKKLDYPFEKKGDGQNQQEGGLYDDQINKIMSHFKDYKGTIMRDEIKTLLPGIEPKSRVAFIINTDTSDKPGQHWQAVLIDSRDGPESSNSLEFYDSFGRSIPPDVLQDCKLILKMLKPSTVLKLKENRVIAQSDNSSNCGFFCCRFLMDRFRGKSFAAATGYDDKVKINEINKNEKEIEKLKQTKPFSFIFVD